MGRINFTHLFSLGVVLSGLALGAAADELSLAGGDTLFFERVGNGSKIIIVSSHAYTFPALRALEDPRWTVIGYDPRSRGRSSFVEDASILGMEQDLSDLDTLRRHLGADKVSLIGFSFGGWITTAYASRYPERIDRLGLLAPGPVSFQLPFKTPELDRSPAPPEAIELSKRTPTLRAEGRHLADPQSYCIAERSIWSVSWFSQPDRHLEFPDYIGKLCSDEYLNEWPIGFAHRFAARDPQFRRETLYTDMFFERLTAATLLIHGDRDRNSPVGGSLYWAWRLPNARIVVIENQAHAVHFEENQRVVEAFRDFFGGAWPNDAEVIEQTPLTDATWTPG